MWFTAYRVLGIITGLGDSISFSPIQVPAARTVAATPEVRLGNATMKTWPDKDPDEIIDYAYNWSTRSLGDDTIASTTADVISGTAQVAQHQKQDQAGIPTGQATVTWLRGGAENETVQVRLRIITTAGRQMDETMSIKIVSR